MAGCRFGSPELVTSLAGTAAQPTFAWDASNSAFLGLPGSFTSANGATCSFPTRSVGGGRTSTYAITPVLITGTRTTSCAVLRPSSIVPGSGGSTTYSGIECPLVTGRSLAAGRYTLRFNQPNVFGAATISSRTFVVASPTWATDLVTATIVETATASVIASSTTTLTETSTVTEPAPGLPETTTTTFTAPAVTVTEDCTSASSDAATPSPTLGVSLDGRCGTISGQTCLGSNYGDCCSGYNFCGSSPLYCLMTEGCQSDFGSCETPSSSSSAPAPTSTIPVSPDGTCGGANGYVCSGSGFGDCCSPYGWCGSLPAHCGAGCQIPFGTCNNSPTGTGTAPLPTSTLAISLDGNCGAASGQTCVGSDFGDCCSEYGFCGGSAVYCGTGCQEEYGACAAPPKRLAVGFGSRDLRKTGLSKRIIGGAGPDYTYPPIPRTTSTVGATSTVTVTPTEGVLTTTVLETTTVTAGAAEPVTETETVVPTESVCA